MRLHTLSLSAFGSFAGSESIDFDQLADTGLFLLHGPTGAGKTTVLDAVSFALFGTVAGVRPAGHGLRSDHAEPTTPTEVRLEVTLDGRRFRIVRRPRQLRPKRRGEGFIEDAPTATVQELVGASWVARAAKPNEADPFLAEHLHMGVSQFHQIVMLPQGDFARFLRANADDRRVVLEELFATHRFTEVERWLRARAEADRVAVSAADDGVRDLLVAAATIADAVPYPKDAPLAGATGWLAEVRTSVSDRREAATSIESAARTAHGEARVALDAARVLAERQHRLAEARAARARLDERADDHDHDRARRDAALRAAPVLPLLEQLADAGAGLAAASTAVATGRSALADGPDGVRGLADADRPALIGHDESLVRDLGQINDLLADEAQLEGREAELSSLTEAMVTLDAELEELEAERGAIPARRQAVSNQLDDARAGAARRDALGAAVQQEEQRRAAAGDRDRLAQELAAATGALDDAAAAERAAQQAWLERFQSQLEGQAAALAAALEDGRPCPVCGSPDHPEPASSTDPPVDEHDVAAAKERFDRLAAASRQAQRAVRSLEQLLAAAQATAGPDTIASLDEALAEHRQALLDAEAAADRVPMLEVEAADLDERALVVDEAMKAAHRERRAIDKARSKLEGGLDKDRERITRARAGFAHLAERRAHLDEQRRLIGALATALAAQTQADAAVLTALERAEAEGQRHGFADVTEAGAAALSPTALDELTAAIAAHERVLAETSAELRHPDLLAAGSLPPVELDRVQEAAAGADRDLELASIATDAARKATERLDALNHELDLRLGDLGPKLETYERSRRLAELASGDDRRVTHRMRLSTYVLAARLEQVAQAASERLQRMSNGRYTIVHTDEAPDGRRKGGLGLRIVDAWTSTERETSTLSGGESFFTSLALALGVADVVSAEHGGVTMETMFIDEGFGSLDDDTLQDVMDVLDGLRAGGRAIGIVSHVGDLRTRIASQLEVVKTASGSRLRTTAGASSRPSRSTPSTAA